MDSSNHKNEHLDRHDRFRFRARQFLRFGMTKNISKNQRADAMYMAVGTVYRYEILTKNAMSEQNAYISIILTNVRSKKGHIFEKIEEHDLPSKFFAIFTTLSIS